MVLINEWWSKYTSKTDCSFRLYSTFQLVSHHVICDGHCLVVYEPGSVSRYSSPDSKQSVLSWCWCVQCAGGEWRAHHVLCDPASDGLRWCQAGGSSRHQAVAGLCVIRADTRDWQLRSKHWAVSSDTPPPPLSSLYKHVQGIISLCVCYVLWACACRK